MLRKTSQPRYFKFIAFLLIVPLGLSLQTKPASSAALPLERPPLAASILDSLRQRTALDSESRRLLNVATDFFDPTTGLHSEGVWHNSLVGIASLRLSQTDEARDIAESLWKHSWDGTSFRRRAHSGLWDHSADSEKGLEQFGYYRESAKHRCVQHGMALVFWSLLAARVGDSPYNDQQHRIATSFLNEFWDDNEEKWHTVSRTQGWGTIDRPSASAWKSTTHIDSNDDGEKRQANDKHYYRAVDQAVALLACLVALPMIPVGTKEKWKEIATKTRETLLNEKSGFGYANDETARSYISLSRNRNFWHDGWVVLALLCAERRGCLLEDRRQQTRLRSLVRRLVVRYGHRSSNPTQQKNESGSRDDYDGTLWHWSKSLKPNEASGNVRYCGNNALWYAIRQNLGGDDGSATFFSSSPRQQQEEEDEAFWRFIDELRSGDKDGLASVADVYKQVRLHPNTELACLTLWQFDEFFSPE